MNPKHLKILQQGVDVWDEWREISECRNIKGKNSIRGFRKRRPRAGAKPRSDSHLFLCRHPRGLCKKEVRAYMLYPYWSRRAQVSDNNDHSNFGYSNFAEYITRERDRLHAERE